MNQQDPGRGENGRRPKKRIRTRYIVQVVHRDGEPVIRLLNSRTEAVFREVTAADFIAFARRHRDVGRFLMRPSSCPESAR